MQQSERASRRSWPFSSAVSQLLSAAAFIELCQGCNMSSVPPFLEGVALVKTASPSESIDAAEALSDVPAIALYFSVST